jgi:hypothetical protein
MKRRVWVNSERWSKHNVGLAVSSRRRAPLDPSPPEEKVHALLDADADDGQEPMFNLTANFRLRFHSLATIIVIAHSGLQWVPIPNTLRYGTNKTCFKVLINPNFWNNIVFRKIWVIDTQNFFSRPKGTSNFPYKLFALFLLLIFCHSQPFSTGFDRSTIP